MATILVEALFYGEVRTAKRWDIHRRTIANYRTRLNEEPELAQEFKRKKELFESEWANELAPAIRSALRFIVRAGEEADTTDPDVIHAMAGALKIVASVGLTKDMLDAKLGRLERGGEDGKNIRQLPPSTIDG